MSKVREDVWGQRTEHLAERVANEVIDALGLPPVETDRDVLDLILQLAGEVASLASGPRRVPGRNSHATVMAAVKRALSAGGADAVTGPVYVASSWRNEHQPGVVAALREAGVDCYDFRNPTDGDHGFSWHQVTARPYDDDWAPGEIVDTLRHPIAVRGFGLDFEAMRHARACVLVMPCGRSAHIEAGYFVGAGRPLHVLLTAPTGPELMWRMAYETGGSIHSALETVVAALGGGRALSP